MINVNLSLLSAHLLDENLKAIILTFEIIINEVMAKRDRITGFFTDLAKGLKAFKKGIAEEDSSCESSKKSNDIDKK